MIEDFQGKIINDADVSLPTMEDMYYNSLAPILDIDLKTEETAFYIETPPDGEDAVGMSADGTIFTIKTGPGHDKNGIPTAFDIPTLSVHTNMNSYISLAVTSSKCDVGNNAQNKELLNQLANNKALLNYLKQKYGERDFNLGDFRIRLLYVDGPKLPKYTTEWLEKKYVEKVKYKDVKNKDSVHIQPFQSEFDVTGGTMSIDSVPDIKEYKDDNDIYVWNNHNVFNALKTKTVQVWPYSETTLKTPLYDEDRNNTYNSEIDLTSDDYGLYTVNDRDITEEDYKRVNLSKLEITEENKVPGYKKFTPLDSLGRCGSAIICVEHSTITSEYDRLPLGPVNPSGWHNYFFECVPEIDLGKGEKEEPVTDGPKVKRALYNRCHLLAYKLSRENINQLNLITGTINLNQVTMYEYEVDVYNYILENPDKHVLYRVTPVFHNDNKVAHGVLIEALSVEDNGKSLSIFKYCYNTQKDVVIDYKTGEAWEYGDKDNGFLSKYAKFYVLNNNEAQLETIKLAFKLRNLAINTILSAEDTRICVSMNSIGTHSRYNAPYDSGYIDPDTFFGKAIEQYSVNFGDAMVRDNEWFRCAGYNLYGLDSFNRALGVVYVKIKINDKLEWVNLNKYLIYQIYNDNTVKQSDFIPNGVKFTEYYKDPTGDRFKAWTYDIENFNYQDNWWTQMETKLGQDLRRRQIQERVFREAGIHPSIGKDTSLGDGKFLNCLKDWTVSIGDVSFFCPPSAIRTYTTTSTERLPVLRAKGSMAKNIEKARTEIELDLYFNNEYGINGHELNIELWENKDKEDPKKKIKSDEKITYYMNGLRALIAEFKFTPFLPIVNTYINRTLKIGAVSLGRLDIETVPNFPRLLKARLILEAFDYNIYMPEVPEMFVLRENSDTNEVENPFAQCINYDVMRYYYQKPLIYGNELANKLLNPKESGYSFNSIDFIKDTVIKNKTALMPCQFLNPNIDIYIANEDYLKRLHDIKKDAINNIQNPSSNFVPNSAESKFLADIHTLWINCEVGRIYYKYAEYRLALVKAYKDTLPPKNAKYKAFLGNKTIYGPEQGVGEDELQDLIRKHVLQPMFEEIKKACYSNTILNSEGLPLVKDVYLAPYTKITTIQMNAPYNSEARDIQGLWDQFILENKIDAKFNEGIIRNSVINLDLHDQGYTLTSSDPDEFIQFREDYIPNFLNWCAENSEKYLQGNQEASELKEAIDWENAKTIQYDLIAENVRVDSFKSSMTNNFASVYLLESEGYAYQYLGSSDIHINWSITTKDEEFAMIMKRLPEMEAYFMRQYNMVLPCFPIRIDSEFTRLIGVFEVSIEQVIVTTVPNQPELYHIEVRAISVDRTLRNREALKSIDNKIDSNINGISGEIDNKQLVSSSLNTKYKIKTYDDLDEKLALAEVYPDLELPTIGELGEKGFMFIRYKEKARDRNDLFVDPDFYFFYPYSATAEVIKSVIQANFNITDLKNTNTVTNMTSIHSDNSGNSGVTFTAKDNKVSISHPNEKYREEIEKVLKAQAEQQANLANVKNTDIIKAMPAAFLGDPGKWNISTKIASSFMESYYLGLKDLAKNEWKKVVTSDGKPDEERIKKLKELKEFADNLMSSKDAAIDNLYKKLRETSVDNSFITGTEIEKNDNLDPNAIYVDLTNNFGTCLNDLYMKYDNVNETSFKNMLLAIWAANTGAYEYNDGIAEDWWQGKIGFMGWYKNNDNECIKASETTPFEQMQSFGCFDIHTYSYPDIINIISQEEREELTAFYSDYENDDYDLAELKKAKRRYLLDPYYRFASDKEIEDYLKRCQLDIDFAARAFSRIILYWLYRLYKEEIFPSVTLDVMAKNTQVFNEAKVKAKKLIEQEYKESVYVDENLLESIEKFVEKNREALDTGKIFCALVMAIYDVPLKSNQFFNMMISRDYEGLNNKVAELVSFAYKKRAKVDSKDALFRKFLLALAGFKEIAGPEYIGRSNGITPASRFITNHNVKIAIAAASDPKQFLFHSYYDMLRNDYRGRMLRAFPTFYCIFMDEGKEIGLWKLHDNFYSINSILDINIVKSRKIPADTCTLVLSNNYSTFTTDDEDGYINYRGSSFRDLWDSVFHKKQVANEAEQRRLAATKVNKAKLSPGIRIHVREGYGSDARELSGLFNGVISSVEPNNQAINIVAQGNGVELVNPILEDRDADEIQYKDVPGDALNNTEGGGASPRTILTSFLTTNNGAFRTYLRGEFSDDQMFWDKGIKDLEDDSLFNTWARWAADAWNTNAYGIVHFGDPKYKDVFPGGEIVQNIYEVSSLPNMDENGVLLYDNKDLLEPPYISFEPRGKTFWDIMHICKSVAPDYITGTAGFGFRDTIFFGKPHYYYAYEYKKFNGVYVEKRKPFSQYHILTSQSDIMVNNITASAEKIRTCATGLYKDKAAWMDRNKEVGPIWVDKNIYPEYQKSVLVDTRLKMKDNNPLLFRNTSPNNTTGNFLLDGAKNFVLNSLQSLANLSLGAFATIGSVVTEDFLGGMFDDKGTNSNHKKIAWAATANSLKDSIKEMYQGELVILGYPSIKPHDRIFIRDQYNDMNGAVLVRDVVHNLNARTGFTSTIHVDAISTVDDRQTEMAIQNMSLHIVAQAGLGLAIAWILNRPIEKGLQYISEVAALGKGKIKDAIDTKYIKGGVKTFKNALNEINTFVKDKKKLSAVWNVFKAGGAIAVGAVAGPTGVAATLGAYVASFVIRELIAVSIMGTINDLILYSIKNHQALQIFPLKKNGMVYTAGLEGNLGLVYGSPTYNEFGPLEKIFKTVFAQEKDDSLGAKLANFFRLALLTPEIQDEASKYVRDLSYASRIGDNAEGQEIAIESVSIGINKKPHFNIIKKNAFDLSLGNRAVVKNKDNKEYRAVKASFNRYHVEKVDDLLAGSERKNQILINQYTPIKQYINSKFLVILHDSLANEKKINTIQIDTVIANQKVEVVGIKPQTKEDIIDIPFLSKDALIVLKDICDRCWIQLDIDNKKDEISIEKELNGTKIIVCSALRIGDPNWYCSSGFSFSIRGLGKLANGTLKQIIDDYILEIENRLKSLDPKDPKPVCFTSDFVQGSDEIRIKIAPESILAVSVKKKEKKEQEEKEKETTTK